jgi:hypothetical protein
MPEALARARLVHQMKGRSRIRFPEQRGNAAFFDHVASTLARHSSVLQLRVSADTGSVLVLHTGELTPIMTHAQKAGLFELAPPSPPRASLRTLRNWIDAADDRVAKETNDAFSVGTLAFLGLVGAGIFQAKNGHLLPAGMTLFKHALEMMNYVAEREPTNSRR